MKYILKRSTLDALIEIEIDEARFQRLGQARVCLSAALRLEEHYEIVLANYKDLERTAIDLLMERNIVTSMPGYDEFFEAQVALNRVMINLLSAARTYFDTYVSNVEDCVPETKDARDQLKKASNDRHAADVDYRVMEALRNYVQHRGLPIHAFSVGSRWDETRTYMEYSVNYAASKAQLGLDSRFKPEVLAEIPERVDLQTAPRGYVDSISHIHVQIVRPLIGAAVVYARAEMQAALNEYYEADSTRGTVGLAAMAFDDGGDLKESFPILINWDDVRQRLERKNSRATILRHSFITTKNVPH